MNKKDDHNTISQYPNSVDTRVALLEMSISHINETLIRIDKRFDKIDERFDKIDERFNKIDQKIDSNFKWTLSLLVIPFYSSIIGLFLGKVLHWF